VYYAAAGQTAWMKKKDGSQVRFLAFGGAYARLLRARFQVPSAACNNALLAKSYAAVVMVRLTCVSSYARSAMLGTKELALATPGGYCVS
jgi:hypothetical protein